MLTQQLDTCIGVYAENGTGMEWGYAGSIAIMSKTALESLLGNIDSCSDEIVWVMGTKWGPIGENLLAQTCMDLLVDMEDRGTGRAPLSRSYRGGLDGAWIFLGVLGICVTSKPWTRPTPTEWAV